MLYNLEEDPGETTNLYEEEAYLEIREEMLKRLAAWAGKVGDQGMATEYEATFMFPDKISHLKMPVE